MLVINVLERFQCLLGKAETRMFLALSSACWLHDYGLNISRVCSQIRTHQYFMLPSCFLDCFFVASVCITVVHFHNTITSLVTDSFLWFSTMPRYKFLRCRNPA
ncbi:hypothetical protein KC19_1G098000 [Ceratodon purpureus]|uniref:Uncharacterized protein n=1 Tax=Ceratodon purpureus TaxID=3225 RepID=A0A8T0J5Y3_CERPU|nr:hypothetical protein KC19_1G098000 [Ceratodon purpureus]